MCLGGAAALAAFAGGAARGESLWLAILDPFTKYPTPVQPIAVAGPRAIPDRLSGSWRVDLCVREGYSKGHAWLRFEHLPTGEVHTIGRFLEGLQGTLSADGQQWLLPPTEETGLHWDYDLRYEADVRAGKYVVDSVVVHDPIVFRGSGDFGHGIVRNNCITFARDAWFFYTGRWVDLPAWHVPHDFANRLRQTLHR